MNGLRFLPWASLLLILLPGLALADVPWTQESEQLLNLQWGQWIHIALDLVGIVALVTFSRR